ncbi:MAG: prepilin-type N-terminal cleavage/methylation domain-containing protein, partial [Filifactor alocis]|nr:prepilin-type N-terminal cleavage/methylation domain-containing protein [Filifactor alocis]
MNKRNKGFTLIELVIVLAISGILITISTNWYITSVAKANNNNNKHIDLQSGVSTSMEMIKNTLKKTVQVTLVDKKVYDPEISLNDLISRNLDNNYNYIALYKDPVSTEYTLSNIVFNQGIGR